MATQAVVHDNLRVEGGLPRRLGATGAATVPDRAAYKTGVRLGVQTLAMIAVAVGVSLLAGGHERFDNAPAFANAKTAPGGYLFWAVLMIATGCWTLGSTVMGWRRRAVMCGLFSMCTLFTYFTIALAIAAAQTTTTPWTGVAIYGGYSVLCAGAYVIGHELRKMGAP